MMIQFLACRQGESGMTLHRQLALLICHVGLVLLLASSSQAADGDLDTSFDGDGIAITDLGGTWSQHGYGRGMAIQDDGKIVLFGERSGSFAAARLLPGGALDTTFGTTGVVITAGGVGNDMALAPDGKIVGVGKNGLMFAVIRYNADGTLDTSLAGDGIQSSIDLGGEQWGADYAYGVAIQPDGKIVVAGQIDNDEFGVARFNVDGSLDTTFSGDGLVMFDFGGTDTARAVAIDANGKIVAAGFTATSFALVRLNANGSPDTTFSGDGKVTTQVGDRAEAYSLLIQSDGKIVIGGTIVVNNYGSFALARYNTDGSLDTSFDGDGIFSSDFGNQWTDYAYALAQQDDGKIIASGTVNSDLAVVRFNADGSLDTTFHEDGIRNHNIGALEYSYDVALQADRKIVQFAYASGDFYTIRILGDGTPPALGASNPADEAAGVAIGSAINVTFDDDMDADTLTTGTFTVSGGVTGTVAYDAGTRTATFTPSANLAYATTYTVTVTTGAADVAGNALAAPIVIAFTTTAAPDATPPTVTGTVPADGAAGVAANASVNATFSEPMDAATMVAANFSLKDSGNNAVAAAVSYDAPSRTITMDPNADLAWSETYTATISTGSQDAAHNPLAAPKVWSFTTADAPDTTPPTVTITSPVHGATDVAVNAAVTATFDEPMDAATLTSATFTVSGGVNGTVAYDGPNRRATFTPSADLSYATGYTATITTGAEDAAGNGLAAPKVWSFTTGEAPDTTAPTVNLTSPAAGAASVAVNTSLTARFDEDMNAATMNAAAFTLADAGGNPVAGAVSFDAPSRTMTFDPNADLAWNTLHTATITTNAADEAGNPLAAPFAWTFTTESQPDLAAPTVTAVVPLDTVANVAVNTALTATFSEPMNPATIDADSFRVSGGVTGTVTWDPDTLRAIFVPSEDLDYSTSYTATLTTGVRDLAGNPLAQAKNWTFTTVAAPDTTLPTVTLTSPTGGAMGVDEGAIVTATFSEAIDPATIGQASFLMSGGVTGAVSYDAGSRTATFNPAADLAHATIYTATLTTAVRDLAGNPLAANVAWVFTTAAAPAEGGWLDEGGDEAGSEDDEEGGSEDEDGPGQIQEAAAAVAATIGISSVYGGGQIVIDTSENPGTGIADADAMSERDPAVNQTNRPSGVSFGYGLVEFQVTGVPVGGTVLVRVVFPEALPPGARIYKVGTAGFYDYSDRAAVNGNEVALYLTDGGAGDADGVANGVILDPVGIATPAGAAGSSSGGGGGCVLDPEAGFGAEWLVLMASAALLLARQVWAKVRAR